MASPIEAALPVNTFNTPVGIPAAINASARCTPESGVLSEGLATTVQPAANAAAQARAGLYAGKFHAVITPITPIGCQMVELRLSILLVGIVLPQLRLPSSAYHSNKLAATAHSPFASASGFPLSSTISFANASTLSRMC